MKTFARMTCQAVALRRLILVSSLALAAAGLLGGCDRWQRSVEAHKQAARDGLTARKAFLAGALPESVRSAVLELRLRGLAGLVPDAARVPIPA